MLLMKARPDYGITRMGSQKYLEYMARVKKERVKPKTISDQGWEIIGRKEDSICSRRKAASIRGRTQKACAYTLAPASQAVKIWNLCEAQNMILYWNNLPFNSDKRQMAYCTGNTSLIEILLPPLDRCIVLFLFSRQSWHFFFLSLNFILKLTVGNFSNDLTP